MSDEPKYDYPYRLQGTGSLIAGAGGTVEEAEAAKKKVKRSSVPSIPMTRPEDTARGDTAPGDADLKIVGRLEDIFRSCAEIRGILDGEPDGVFPPKFRDFAIERLFEILETGDLLWQALAPNAARMTMAGFIAKIIRDGGDPSSIQVVPKEKKEE